MTEIWKKIKGYDGIYEVSNKGRVRSNDMEIKQRNNSRRIKKGRILKEKNHDGYVKVRLYNKTKFKEWFIHRLVAEHFLDEAHTKETVNHINGIKNDNRVENLEWATRSENTRHAVENNLTNNLKGEKHGMSKLTEKQVVEIKQMLNDEKKQIDIAKKYGVSESTIQDIRIGKSWAWLKIDGIKLRKKGELIDRKKMKEEYRRDVLTMIEKGETYTSIAKKYNVHRNTIRRFHKRTDQYEK